MIVIVMGVSGSGKTTVGRALAAHLGASFRDADDYHTKTNLEAMKQGRPLSDDMRQPWLEAMQADICSFSEAGQSLVLACSALKRSYRDYLFARNEGGKFIYLKGGKREILPRMQQRKGHFFPPGLLDSQLETLEEPQPDEDIIIIPALMEIKQAVAMASAGLLDLVINPETVTGRKA